MRLTRIVLNSFRSYTAADYSFENGINVISGENGKGKTNLLEAVYLLSGCRSWRASKNEELIRWDAGKAFIGADILSRGRDFRTEITMRRRGQGTVLINGVRVTKKSAMSEVLRCVVFSPEDLFLIKGAASKRRALMDGALCQLSPAYEDALRYYERVLALKQRLLRDEGDFSILPEYNIRLAENGARLICARAAFCADLQAQAEKIHREVSGGRESLSLTYSTVSGVEPRGSREDISKQLLNRLSELRSAEEASASCLSGPHKDDIGININGRDAKAYASQGQSRTAAVALKFAERELLRDEGQYPLLLLDDVLSELDAPRQSFILSSAAGGQTFITCCEQAVCAANVIRL